MTFEKDLYKRALIEIDRQIDNIKIFSDVETKEKIITVGQLKKTLDQMPDDAICVVEMWYSDGGTACNLTDIKYCNEEQSLRFIGKMEGWSNVFDNTQKNMLKIKTEKKK